MLSDKAVERPKKQDQRLHNRLVPINEMSTQSILKVPNLHVSVPQSGCINLFLISRCQA